MAEPILIDYNGNQYDLALLRDTVLNNYNDYARRFGYGKNKFLKDYQGLVEILRQLENGNARVETGRLVFNDTFADDKGAFGKARNKSKHYTNPAWMILDTIQRMDKYDKDKGKKKLNKSVLNQELLNYIGDISTLSPEYKIQKLQWAIDELLSQYSNSGNYTVEDEFDLPKYLSLLQELRNALATEGLDDDNFVFSKLGISNINKPEEKKPELLKGYEAFKQSLIDSGYFTEGDEAEIQKAWKEALPELRKKAINAALGITTATEAPATTSSTPSTTTQPSSTTPPATTPPPSTPSETKGTGGTGGTVQYSGTYNSYNSWIKLYVTIKDINEKKKFFKEHFNQNWSDIPRGNGRNGFYRDKNGRIHAPKELASNRLGGYLKLLKEYKYERK